MEITKKLLTKYNLNDSLIAVTSFPKKGSEVAEENAVSRYSDLLLRSFPKNRKVVIICEKRKEEAPYELTDNILVVPSYKRGSLLFFKQILNTIFFFSNTSKVLIQFEFSIYGGKLSLLGIVLLLSYLKLFGMSTTIMMHQVVRNIGSLSGHLDISKNGIYEKVLNFHLGVFYFLIGILSTTVLVHDSNLKAKLLGIISSKKIFVIPHGVGEVTYTNPSLRKQFRKKFKIKENSLVLLAYGYLSWYKGTDWLIKTVGELSKRHPERKVTLVVAGVQSPTLRGSKAYVNYKRKLTRLMAKYKKNLKVTGFVPENDVPGIFAASDICIFPYRTRMSASGALSVAFQYGKRILISKDFSANFEERDASEILTNHDVSVQNITFNLNQLSFQESLFSILDKSGAGYKVARASRAIANSRSWESVALMYDNACFRNLNTSENIFYDYAK